MTISETWLLPDGVADVLPEQAQVIEKLRREAFRFPRGTRLSIGIYTIYRIHRIVVFIIRIKSRLRFSNF